MDVINRVEEEVEDPVLQAVFHHLESFTNYSCYQNPSTINLMRMYCARSSIMPLSRAISIKYLFDLVKLGRHNGYGTIIYESGEVFVGEFSDGKCISF